MTHPAIELTLALLTLWSLTQLATRDAITADIRRHVRWALRLRRHAVSRTIGIRKPTYGDGAVIGCTCGWQATMARSDLDDTYVVIASDESEPRYVTDNGAGLDAIDGRSIDSYVVDEMVRHLRESWASDAGRLYELVTCPWCVSWWIAWPIAGVLALAGWPAVPVLAFPFAARVFAGAAVVHLGPQADEHGDIDELSDPQVIAHVG